MSDLVYKIEKWEPRIPPGKNFPYPMFCIKPSQDFPMFAKDNPVATLSISGTNMNYDTQQLLGYIEPGSNINASYSNYYCVTLLCEWVGYPIDSGTVSFSKDVPSSSLNQKFVPPIPIIQVAEDYIPPKSVSQNNFNSTQIGLIVIFILIVFGLLLLK
jgi:hypothetical protein